MTAQNYTEIDADIRTNDAEATITILATIDELTAEAAEVRQQIIDWQRRNPARKHPLGRMDDRKPVDLELIVYLAQMKALYAFEIERAVDEHAPDEAYEGYGDLDVEVVINVIDDEFNTKTSLTFTRSFEDLPWMEGSKAERCDYTDRLQD